MQYPASAGHSAFADPPNVKLVCATSAHGTATAGDLVGALVAGGAVDGGGVGAVGTGAWVGARRLRTKLSTQRSPFSMKFPALHCMPLPQGVPSGA